jgi:hypothetical protein
MPEILRNQPNDAWDDSWVVEAPEVITDETADHPPIEPTVSVVMEVPKKVEWS